MRLIAQYFKKKTLVNLISIFFLDMSYVLHISFDIWSNISNIFKQNEIVKISKTYSLTEH